MKRNPHFRLLKKNYLFPEVNLRKREFLLRAPGASLISLGIGDTTQPIPEFIVDGLIEASKGLGTAEKYVGYGPEQGSKSLREKIASKIYSDLIKPEEVFVSDGAKCDLGRLQILFGGQISMAVQDPAYPVYIDGSLMQGVQTIIPLPCRPENDFFPDLSGVPAVDLIYFCSPNNPTGATATYAQLEQLVGFAQANRSIIIFDAAYANYIQDPSLPTSIYQIQGAKRVAIEINSFSKRAGFTGVRLGWTVFPEELLYEDGSSVQADWNRLMTTIFNGASHISQSGGYRCLEEEGWKETLALSRFYLENARLIREKLKSLGYEVFGGENAPYLWVRFRERHSWDIFQYFLENFHLVTTPGIGFGPSGREFIRISAFEKRKDILQAIERLAPMQ